MTTALITGGAHRIGRAIVQELSEHGWAVAIHYHRSGEAAADLVHEIQQRNGKACALQADLSDPQSVPALVDRATEKLGLVTLLVNNASVFEYDTVNTVNPSSWSEHFAVNLESAVYLAQRFTELLAPGKTGNIINMVDQRVLKLTPHFFSYTASKAALWTVTQTMAMALAPQIRVNALALGPVLKSKRQTQEHFDALWRAVPLERGADLDEICKAVHFILESPSMTGHMIPLDGGQHLAWQTPDIIGIEE